MGQKKRNLAPRSKSSNRGVVSPDSAVGTDEAAGGDLQSEQALVERDNNIDYSAIKAECERALTAFRRGNHTKALRLIKDACQRNAKSALLHRCQGTVSVKVAGIMDDPAAKQRHLKSAIESARKACSLSPNSIEFAHFYANLLYEAAQDGKDYDDVAQECERALAIENPIDPAKESFQEEQKIPTAEARIANMQQELRSLVQKSHIASISTWMKHLGNGEEKFHLIQLRRPPEDPMELKSVQTRRLNEIKKATKTPEERRKEIEVRIAAARLLQQKSESPGNENKTEGSYSAGSSHKSAERKKHGSWRKKTGSSERKDQVMPFWNSMSYEMKKDLLAIRANDLRAHFQLSKNGLYSEILSEALSFAKANRTWFAWVCCRCGEKSADAESHMHHLVQEHIGDLMPKLQPVLPQAVDNERLEMLAHCSWKPLDIAASIEILECRPKLKDTESGDNIENDNDENKVCVQGSLGDSESHDHGARDSTSENLAHGWNGRCLENGENDKDLKIECVPCDGNPSSKIYTLPNAWPLSDDIERAKLLEKIGSIFQLLAKHKFLAVGHLHKVIQFTMDELQGLAPGSPLLHCGIDRTPLCICFLGSGQLREVLKFIQEVSHACGLGRYSEKISPHDTEDRKKLVELGEKLVLSEDNSFLFLDEGLLPDDGRRRSEVLPLNAAAATINSIPSASDSFLSWIFEGPTSGEQLAAWSRNREERTQQAVECLQLLEKEFGGLQSMCERKHEHLGYEEVLRRLGELCLEERKKGENGADSTRRSFESILRKHREELIEGKNDAFNGCEIDVINSVLKEAENVNASQFGGEEIYMGAESNLCALESGEDWKSIDRLNQSDTCVEIAINREKEQLAVELSRIDARLMRNVGIIKRLEHQLESLSTLDYLSILLPLVKSFLRAHLEDLAEKDATEKSDAAREALLAEIALDSKKNSGGGGDQPKHTQNKTKDKKRNKDFKKAKETKISCFSEQLATSEPVFYPGASGGDTADPQAHVSESSDDFQSMDEDARRRIELEAEERMLEETLEYQRRIENEAKMKHLTEQRLAEQWRRNSQTDLNRVFEESDNSSSPYLSTDGHCQPGYLELDNGSPNSWGTGPPVGATSMASYSSVTVTHQSNSSQSYKPTKVRQGSSNGEIPGNNAFTKEQRSVRNGKCKSAGLPNRRLQGAPLGKENINVGISKMDVQQNRQNVNHDSVHSDNAHEMIHLPDVVTHMGGAMGTNENKSEVYGTGLQNEAGEYNCFLNVIIQSLWHLRRFREELFSRQTSEHSHVGDPCVACVLYAILNSLSEASADAKKEAVATTSLRAALRNLYPESNFFQEGQMNDASEVLVVIFDCLHKSSAFASGTSDDDSVESSSTGTWDCTTSACIAHSLFGLNVFERMNCFSCRLESRHMKYTSFFHYINATALRTMKDMVPESSFDELLDLVQMNDQKNCDPEVGGCGKPNHIHHILSAPPNVFITVLGWQNTCENVDDIMATLAAVDTEIDISVLYRGLDPKSMRRLVSVVCYYGQHYHCFAYNQDSKQWVMYDDKMVKVIGSWDDVLSACRRGHLQPQVLFYEAVN